MIKANELRIGNYILFKEYGKGEGIIGRIKPGDFGRVVGGSDEYHPISLTDDWFKCCGFIRKEGSRVWILPIDYIDSDWPCTLQLSGSGIQICRSGIGAICAPVFHVHSLQNLYYSLTGQDIAIKEPAKQNPDLRRG